MNSENPFPLLTWLARHAGFPRHRLPAKAELLLCFASAAARDEPGEGGKREAGGAIPPKDNPSHVVQKQHALRRSHAHFKADNRTKV